MNQIKKMLIERRIGLVVVALLVAYPVLTLLEQMMPILKYLVITYYNAHRAPDTFQLDPYAYGFVHPSAVLQCVATLAVHLGFAALLYLWLFGAQRRNPRSN